MMSFAAFSEMALLGMLGAGALSVLLLYLLRRSPKPQWVSSVVFWQRAAQASRPRFLLAWRIPWLALLVSLLVVALFVAELGDPRFGRGVGGTTVIVLHAGRTMHTTFEGQSRMDRALLTLRQWVDRTTVEGEVAVVVAGMHPSVLMPLTRDPTDLDRALPSLLVSEGRADLAAGLRLADQIISEGGERGQILLLADREVELSPPTRAPTVHLPVGVVADTLAITRFSARRDPEAAGEFQIHCQVGSFASGVAHARLRIADGDLPLLERDVTLSPGRAVEFDAHGFSAARAELVATLTAIEIEHSIDAFSLDDQASAIVPALSPLRVLLVTAGNAYLEAVMALHPNATTTVMSPGEFHNSESASLRVHDVLLLDRVGLPASIEHPSVLLFSPPDGQIPMVATAENPALSAFLASHPILSGLRLTGTRVGRSGRFSVEPGDEVLIRSHADPLALARDTPTGRRVAYGLDLSVTDLVQREAFPLLVHNSLRWVSASTESVPLPHRLGESLTAAPGELVLGPDHEPVAPWDRAPIGAAGIYHVSERAMAFGATDLASELPGGASGGRLRKQEWLPSLGLLIAGVLLALMLLEWGLLHRGKLS